MDGTQNSDESESTHATIPVTNVTDEAFTENLRRAHEILQAHQEKRHEYIEILTRKTLYKTHEETEKEEARNAFFDVTSESSKQERKHDDSQINEDDSESSLYYDTPRARNPALVNPELALNLPKERDAASNSDQSGPVPNLTPRTHILSLVDSKDERNRSHFALAKPQRDKLVEQTNTTFVTTHHTYFALQSAAEANMQTLYLHQGHIGLDEISMHREMMKTVMDEYEYYRERLESLWDDIGRIERFHMIDQYRVEELFGRRHDLMQVILEEEKEQEGQKSLRPQLPHQSSTTQITVGDSVASTSDDLEDESTDTAPQKSTASHKNVWNDKSVQLREQAERIKQKHLRMKYLANMVKLRWREFVLQRRFDKVHQMHILRQKTDAFIQWKELTVARTQEKFRCLRRAWDSWIQYTNYRFHAAREMRRTLQHVYYSRLVRIAFIFWKRWAHFRRLRRLDPQCTEPPEYETKLLCWDDYISFRITTAQRKRVADKVYTKTLLRAAFNELQHATMVNRMLHERELHWMYLAKIKIKKEVFEEWKDYTEMRKQTYQPNLLLKKRIFKKWRNLSKLRHIAESFPEVQNTILLHGFFFRWRKRYLQRRLLENAATVQIITRRPDALLAYSIIAEDHVQYSLVNKFNKWKRCWLGRKLFYWYIGKEWEARRIELLRYYFYTWKHKRQPSTRYALEGIREHLLLEEFERFKRQFMKDHARGSNRVKSAADLERHQWLRHLFVDFMEDADPQSKLYIFRKLFMLAAYKLQEMTAYRTKMILAGDWNADMKYDPSQIKASHQRKLVLARKIVSLFMKKQLAQAKGSVDELLYLMEFIREHIAKNRQIMIKKMKRDREVALKYLAKEAAIKLAKVSRSFRAVVEHTQLSSVATKQLEARQLKQRQLEEVLQKRRNEKMEKKMESVRTVMQKIKDKSNKKAQHIWDDILEARVARRSSEASIDMNKKRSSTTINGPDATTDETIPVDSEEEDFADDLPSDIFTGRDDDEESKDGSKPLIETDLHLTAPLDNSQLSSRSNLSDQDEVQNHLKEYTNKIREMLDKPQEELPSFEENLKGEISSDGEKVATPSVRSTTTSPSSSPSESENIHNIADDSSQYMYDDNDRDRTIDGADEASPRESLRADTTHKQLFGQQDSINPFTPQTPTQDIDLEYSFSSGGETPARKRSTLVIAPRRSRSSSKAEPYENNQLKALQVAKNSTYSLVTDDASKKLQAVRRTSGEILNYKSISTLDASLALPSAEKVYDGESFLGVPFDSNLDSMSEELQSEDEDSSHDDEDNAAIERLSTWLWDQSYRADPMMDTPDGKNAGSPARLLSSRAASRAIFGHIGTHRSKSQQSLLSKASSEKGDEFITAIISLGKEINSGQVGQSHFSIQEEGDIFTVRFPTEDKKLSALVSGTQEIPFHDRMMIRTNLAQQKKHKRLQEQKALQQRRLEAIMRMQKEAASWTEQAAKIANDFQREQYVRSHSPTPALSPQEYEVRTFRLRKKMSAKDSVTALELILRLNLKQEQLQTNDLAQELMELRKKVYPLIVSMYEEAERSHPATDDGFDRNLMQELSEMKLKMTEMERYLGVEFGKVQQSNNGLPPVPSSTSDQIPVGTTLPYLLDLRNRTSFDYTKSPQEQELIHIAIENSQSFNREWRRKLSLADDEGVENQWNAFMDTLVERLQDESSEVREEAKQAAQRKRRVLMKQVHNFTQIIQSMRLTILQTKQQQATSALYGNVYFEEKIGHIERGLVEAENALHRSSSMLKELQSVFAMSHASLGKRSLKTAKRLAKIRRAAQYSHRSPRTQNKSEHVVMDIDRSIVAPSPEAPLSPYLEIEYEDTPERQELKKAIAMGDTAHRSSFSAASDPGVGGGTMSDSDTSMQEMNHRRRLRSPLLKSQKTPRDRTQPKRSRPRSASVSRTHRPRSASSTRDLMRAKLIDKLSKEQT